MRRLLRDAVTFGPLASYMVGFLVHAPFVNQDRGDVERSSALLASAALRPVEHAFAQADGLLEKYIRAVVKMMRTTATRPDQHLGSFAIVLWQQLEALMLNALKPVPVAEEPVATMMSALHLFVGCG